MLERLAGRLRWERTPEGMLVTIPVRRGTTIVLYSPLVLIWVIIASVRYWNLLSTPHPDDSEFTLQMVAMAIYAVGLCFFVCWVTWIFTGETILTLVPAEMKIQRRVIGIELSTRSFPTNYLRDLKYVPPGGFWALSGYIDPNTSCIQFRSGDMIYSFANGITRPEANALTAKMLNVYPFPGSEIPDLIDDWEPAMKS
jgi:hypothetical protein